MWRPIARAKVFDTMSNPVIVLDKDGLIADFNNYAKLIFPQLSREAIGLNAHEVLGMHRTFMEKIRLDGNEDTEVELSLEHGIRYFNVTITKLLSPKKEDIGLIILLHDITKNRLRTNKLHRMATVDALTQVRSRRFFTESSLREIRLTARKKGTLSFLLLDIDHFKNVNDSHGHIAGDLVLKNVAKIFRKILRASDIAGRYGGEEFTILLPDTDLAGAKILSERLRAAIEETTTIFEDAEIRVTISVGVSSISFEADTPEIDCEKVFSRLFKDADQALYKAKGDGRNQVCVLSEADTPAQASQ